jgi:serine/threonine protein kinase
VHRPDAAEIYAQALEQEDLEARNAYLLHACEQDPKLRRRIEVLLNARAARGDFLESPLVDPGTAPRGPEGPGTAIGPYLLLEEIGEGGMGVVFMAQQSAPVRRRVALKILKPGLDTRAVIARFEIERQALALMDHANIARIFDAGTADSGRPYFVMELVHGVPITDYCDTCQLAMHDRLDLMIAVCRAVHHAHQKGVIHRDLKPTNILITVQDGCPVPKVIDFGVAKATGDRLTDCTLATGFAQMIGTPLYMSPEQAELSPVGVDERTDVYALGVLLYELLVGATPFDKDQLREAPLDELRRIVREVEPLRPSVRFSTLNNELATTVVERRRTNDRRMRQILRGELEWIVMRCLEKDRTRRYPSASELAADLGRYLSNQPVEARRPTRLYKLWKFTRRHKVMTAMATASAIVVMVAAIALSWRARTRADKAAAMRLWEQAVEMHLLGNLDEAEVQYNQATRLQPTWPELRIDRGNLNAARGRPDEALRDFTKASELSPENADYLSHLGMFAIQFGQWDVAIDAYRRALKLTPNNDLYWYRYSALLLFTGDERAFRHSCREMLDRFSRTIVLVTAERTAKTCLLTPDAVPDPKPVQKLAALVTQHLEAGGSTPWYFLLASLAEYRAGDGASALEWLNSVPLDAQPGNFNGTVFTLRALAHFKLDQPAEAAKWLDKANECRAKWPDVNRGEVFDEMGDWLRFRILLNEAHRLMDSQQSHGAPHAQ